MEEMRLLPPPNPLTATEETILRRLFQDLTLQKYLHLMLWDLIVDNANIPLATIAADLQEHALKQAYVKGGISVIHTLLSVNKSQEQPQQPQQGT